MSQIWILLTLVSLAASPGDPPENPLYRSIRADGLTVNDTTIKLNEPTLADGLDPASARAALKTWAGDDRSYQELLRDSVTAPFVLKTRDLKAANATIRVIDLGFIIHARLDEIDLDQALGQGANPSVEVGNMQFETRLLTENELRDKKTQPLPPAEGRREWWTHLKGRLLDRIQVEATDRAVATRSATSLLIASQTDPSFQNDPRFPNRWATLNRQGAGETTGSFQTYPGSISLVKLTEIPGEVGALFVEIHLAFVEPVEWFQGNPILRSKFSLIAQDQVRRLRREILKKRKEPKKSA